MHKSRASAHLRASCRYSVKPDRVLVQCMGAQRLSKIVPGAEALFIKSANLAIYWKPAPNFCPSIEHTGILEENEVKVHSIEP